MPRVLYLIVNLLLFCLSRSGFAPCNDFHALLLLSLGFDFHLVLILILSQQLLIFAAGHQREATRQCGWREHA